ncbi:MAG TPA: anti-sigma factor [Chloroflexaceae bacterium]|nr:anti-sigma factor [Chloroflexaceae bacterium]
MNANDQNYVESQLAAYALGALDAEDQQGIEALLARSPAHQEELRQLREVVALLPYAAPPAAPPERVRAALFARVEADRAPAAPAPSRRAARPWFVPATMAALAALVLALGGLAFNLSANVARLDRTNAELVAIMAGLQQSLDDTQARQEALTAQLADGQRQLAAVSAQLAAGEEQLAQLNARLARDEYVISFVSAPGVATRQLAPADFAAAARGEMYMYPGESSAVAIFSGLPPLAPGQVYQFWLADGATQVAGGTFEVDETGLARIVVEAPREVNAFSEVMVTVEPSGGSPEPSDQVVLAGSL